MLRITGIIKNTKRLWGLSKKQIWNLIFELLHPVEEDRWGIVCPGAIGDTYFICGFAEAILRNHGGIGVTLFVKPEHLFIPTLFPSVSKVIPVKKIFDISLLGCDEFGRGNIFRAQFPYGPSLHLLGRKNITLLDYYRALFRLPFDTQLSKPLPPSQQYRKKAADWFKHKGLPIGKTVILAPEAVSSPVLSRKFWIELASSLSRKGWVPVTNTNNTEKVIPGTTLFDVPLQLLPASAELAGRVIATRSGLCDLLSSTEASLTVLYPNDDRFPWGLFEGSSLQAMGLSAKITELKVENASTNEITEKLLT